MTCTHMAPYLTLTVTLEEGTCGPGPRFFVLELVDLVHDFHIQFIKIVTL